MVSVGVRDSLQKLQNGYTPFGGVKSHFILDRGVALRDLLLWLASRGRLAVRRGQRYCAWRVSTGTLRSRSEYFGEIFGKRFRLLVKTSGQMAEENRQKAEKAKERQEAARRKKS
jgi:hypothetical protein